MPYLNNGQYYDIEKETNAWSYALIDGTDTQRQLTDATGEVTYAARYTPWGDTLDSYGTGNFAFGYFGGLMDAATGLLYVGDGQYYDPTTGRFLTRNVRPNSANPYLPFDPTGALFVPLALVSLVYGRKRRKSKWDILVIVALLGLSAGMGVAACGGSGTPSGNITATGTATPVPGGNIVTGTVDINGATMTGTAYVPTSSPYAPIIATPCPTPTGTPTPIPTTDAEYKRIIEERFGIIVSDDTGKWATAHIQIVYSALFNIDVAVGGMLKTLLGTPKKFLREESATYSGTAYGHQINFRFSNKLPHQLIYHEMGHLLNFAQGRKYTYSLDHTAVYTGYPNQTGEFVMGRDCPTTGKCNNPYNRIDGQGYIQHPVIKDPSGYNAETEMHPRKMSADGNTANEEWADLFANFVAGNFDSGDTGRAKYNWVKDQLFGG